MNMTSTRVAEALSIEEKHETPSQLTLSLKGVLDVETAPSLMKMLEACFKKAPEQIRIRMDELSDIDSSGIATLIEGLRWSRSSGGHFFLSGVHDAVRDLIVLSKLEREFEILEH